MSTGGKRSAGGGASTEGISNQKNGKISTSVAGSRTRCHGLNGSHRRRRAGGTPPPAEDSIPPRAGAEVAVMSRPVVDESPADPELDRGDHKDDEEQEVGDGRGVPEVEVHEGLLVEVVDEDRGGVERAALGAQVDLVEQLQRVDREPHGQEQRGGAE